MINIVAGVDKDSVLHVRLDHPVPFRFVLKSENTTAKRGTESTKSTYIYITINYTNTRSENTELFEEQL